MPNDSNSKDKKNTKEENEPQSIKNEDQESNKSAPKKKKRTKVLTPAKNRTKCTVCG
ncbi:MAG: hypothetical protein H8E19_09530 [Deltaproteobacteria bacterium]|uniref:Uncharacterized protein n=1 Tax=Candidatus Desulfacyla euxinica TaxID=2841693 RepID=A0A8J6N0P9_9DELT|nr:hypothetical protein [Candidatus Desulfacyla euxinica]MBL7218136.1 hypothetical protein [Desulfobacteraceae bacterium]